MQPNLVEHPAEIKKSADLVGWTTQRNLGDEIKFEACRAAFKRAKQWQMNCLGQAGRDGMRQLCLGASQLLGNLAIWRVLFVERKVLPYFVVTVGGFTYLDNLLLIFNCLIEITSLGISRSKRVNDVPILPLG